jgi:2-oxoglutarate ferredoxin oxidoreductase subunit beta
MMMAAGIGCHGKIYDYLKISGIYGLHGRGHAIAQGIKIGNPDLKILSFGGDGDSYAEGLEHIIFAAKRNADITSIIHNNGAYALTTGQCSPTTMKGVKGPSTPLGNPEDPLNPLVLLLEAGATFVARGYAGRIDHLADIIVQAVKHPGFSIIDVLQPSVVFTNTYDKYNAMCTEVTNGTRSFEDALKLARKIDVEIPIGIFYQVEKDPHHKSLQGDRIPAKHPLTRDERLNALKRFLE